MFGRLLATVLVLATTMTAADARAEEPSAPPEPAVVTHDATGFRFASADDRYSLRIFGIVQTDFREYLRDSDRTDFDRFLIRRARPYLEGHVMGDFDYRLMMDLGQGEVALLDAFVDAKILGNALRFRAGKYKQPFSYEQFKMEDLTLAVFERSALDILAPARNVGAMVHGSLADGTFEYALGLSNGLRDSDFEEKRNEKDVVGRVVVRPFRGVAPLDTLQLGISAAYGDETDAFDPEAFSTPMRVRYFRFEEGVNASGGRYRASPEVAFFAGPWAFAAQYLEQRQSVVSTKSASPSVMLPMHAFYAMSSLVLTGERRRTYAEFVHPQRPVTLERGWHGTGAVELIARTSGLTIGDTVYDPRHELADPDKTARRVYEVSIGANWYLNRWVWVMANFEYAAFGRPLPLGTGGTSLGNQQSLGLRTTVMW